MMDILYVVAGLGFLFVGGEWLVRGSVTVAEKLGLSTLLVSVIIIGFGTSTPELLVSLDAAIRGKPEIALGNIIGSNIANVMLIMALAAVITPVICMSPGVKRDAVMVLVASLVLTALSFTDTIGRVAGVAMILMITGYIVYCVREDKKKSAREKAESAAQVAHMEEDIAGDVQKILSLPKAIGLCAISLVTLVIGARLLVDGSVSLARMAGISEAVIGLTLVAVGTSLPELAAAIAAAVKKHSDVVIGNILGSSMYNILGILGITAVISPIPFNAQMASFDVWIMLAVAVVTLPIVWFGKQTISRPVGGIMIAAYIGYVYWLFAMMDGAAG